MKVTLDNTGKLEAPVFTVAQCEYLQQTFYHTIDPKRAYTPEEVARLQGSAEVVSHIRKLITSLSKRG